jgi:hypothetical protein
MADDTLLGTEAHSEPQPTAMSSTVHRRFRPRSQITVLDIDLASALSVAPAPHSWRDAEERVLSEFGGDLPTPTSVAPDSQSPHKGYFVDDLKYVCGNGLGNSLFYFYSVIASYIHKTSHHAPRGLTCTHRARARGRTRWDCSNESHLRGDV